MVPIGRNRRRTCAASVGAIHFVLKLGGVGRCLLHEKVQAAALGLSEDRVVGIGREGTRLPVSHECVVGQHAQIAQLAHGHGRAGHLCVKLIVQLRGLLINFLTWQSKTLAASPLPYIILEYGLISRNSLVRPSSDFCEVYLKRAAADARPNFHIANGAQIKAKNASRTRLHSAVCHVRRIIVILSGKTIQEAIADARLPTKSLL